MQWLPQLCVAALLLTSASLTAQVITPPSAATKLGGSYGGFPFSYTG